MAVDCSPDGNGRVSPEGEPMSVPMMASSTLNSRRETVEAGATAGAPRSRYLCFGGFQLDTHREVLLKDGAKLRLPGKVFQTLIALLEKPGEVVTREALRGKLWPQGTFVNYDANVNTTVNKLRLALGDSPERPMYIETIPRLGYCFVGSVERRSELARPEVAQPENREGRKPESRSASNPAAGQARDFWASLRAKGWVAAVLLCGVLIGMGIVLLTHRT